MAEMQDPDSTSCDLPAPADEEAPAALAPSSVPAEQTLQSAPPAPVSTLLPGSIDAMKKNELVLYCQRNKIAGYSTKTRKADLLSHIKQTESSRATVKPTSPGGTPRNLAMEE